MASALLEGMWNLLLLAPLMLSGKISLDVRAPALDRYECSRLPQVSWSKAPPQAKSIAVIAEDEHDRAQWIVINIPVKSRRLTRAPEWTAPCEPAGDHRITIRVYALDTRLPHSASTDRAELFSAMDGHVVADGKLSATYTQR